MVADAHDAVAAVHGVRHAEVVLEDHFAAEAINGGVAARAGFARSFDGEAAGELHELRADFLRKAVLAGTNLVSRPLAGVGAGPRTWPGSPSVRCRRRRRWTGCGGAGPSGLRPATTPRC